MGSSRIAQWWWESSFQICITSESTCLVCTATAPGQEASRYTKLHRNSKLLWVSEIIIENISPEASKRFTTWGRVYFPCTKDELKKSKLLVYSFHLKGDDCINTHTLHIHMCLNVQHLCFLKQTMHWLIFFFSMNEIVPQSLSGKRKANEKPTKHTMKKGSGRL